MTITGNKHAVVRRAFLRAPLQHWQLLARQAERLDGQMAHALVRTVTQPTRLRLSVPVPTTPTYVNRATVVPRAGILDTKVLPSHVRVACERLKVVV